MHIICYVKVELNIKNNFIDIWITRVLKMNMISPIKINNLYMVNNKINIILFAIEISFKLFINDAYHLLH
jgi:hypothetical protein